jgi:hypothetical protein
VKRYGYYGRKVSWIVKRYGKCRRKVSWIVKRYGNYGRKGKLNMEIEPMRWHNPVSVTSCVLWCHRWMTLYAKPINRPLALEGGLKNLKTGSLDM